MDLASHLIITRKFIGKERSTLVAGVMADTPFYLTYPIWLAKNKQFRRSFQTNEWPEPPKWMVTLHHMAHSIPLVFTIALFIGAITKKFPRKFLLSWLIHILIDIPTHSRRQWGPKFLWPFSDYAFDGISWVEAAIALSKRHSKK